MTREPVSSDVSASAALRYGSAQHGVLVVDKPSGPTSHDVVAWARRALRTRAVGHAGTLDPMATGVLVLAIGEATKLVPYLTLDEKEYELELVLGAETDTLDAQGQVVAQAPVPSLDEAHVRAVAARFLGPQQQRAPVYSAIKVDGVALHRRARRGDVVEAPLRDVTAHSRPWHSAFARRRASTFARSVAISRWRSVRSVTWGRCDASRAAPFASTERSRGIGSRPRDRIPRWRPRSPRKFSRWSRPSRRFVVFRSTHKGKPMRAPDA